MASNNNSGKPANGSTPAKRQTGPSSTVINNQSSGSVEYPQNHDGPRFSGSGAGTILEDYNPGRLVQSPYTQEMLGNTGSTGGSHPTSQTRQSYRISTQALKTPIRETKKVLNVIRRSGGGAPPSPAGAAL